MGERQRACKREGQSPRERAKRARRTFEHQARPLKHRPRTTAFTVPVPTAATAATAAAITAAATAATAATTTHGRCIAEPCDGVAGWVDAIHGEPPPQRGGKQTRIHACIHACTRAHTHTRTNAHVVPLVATVGGCGCVIVAAGAPALGFYACMQRLQPPRLWPVPVHGLDTYKPEKQHDTTRCESRTNVVPRKKHASTPKLLTWRANKIRDIVSEPFIYICRIGGF